MSILLLGVDHRRVPLSVLESLAVPMDHARKVLHELVELDNVLEAVVVSTCNRVELYVDLARFHDGYDEVVGWMAERAGMTVADLQPLLVSLVDEEAAAHLFAVTGGLDSMVIGEQQIAMQVRDAMEQARAEGTARRMLQRLFRQAVRVGRRIRRETAITDGASSMVDVGIRTAERRLGSDVAGRRTLVVGAGEVGTHTVHRLTEIGAAEVAVWNRSPEKASRLAAKVDGTVVPTDGLGAATTEADLVVCTTGAPEPVLHFELLREVAASRQGRRLVLLDLAVPRNVDPEARVLPGVTIVDVSSVRESATDRDVTAEVLGAAKAIVTEEAARFRRWLRQIEVEPTVRALREQAEQVRLDELERLSAKLASLDEEQRAAVDALSTGIVNTLLHLPTVRLKALADSGADRHVAALVELFDLDPADEADADGHDDGTGNAR